jgi:hypothetical protein
LRLVYEGRGRLIEGGKAIEHGDPFTVSQTRGERLLADPHVDVRLPDADLTHLTRRELDELAREAGITSPEGLPNKESVIEALTNHHPQEEADNGDDSEH